MLNWNYNDPNIEEIKFETIMTDFDMTFRRLFQLFGLSDMQLNKAIQIAQKEDLNRMTDIELKENQHISSRNTTKWRKYFNEELKNAFESRFGDALIKLGYETSNDW